MKTLAVSALALLSFLAGAAGLGPAAQAVPQLGSPAPLAPFVLSASTASSAGDPAAIPHAGALGVLSTLVLFNNTLFPGNFLAANGANPIAAAAVPAHQAVYIVDYSSGNVSIVNTTTDLVQATVPVGNVPEADVYDPARGEVFVAVYGSNDLSVINTSTESVVATVPVGTGPNWLAYDSGKGEVFVGNESNHVVVVSDVSNSVVATIPVTGATAGIMGGMTYDPTQGEVLVANGASGNLTVISDASNSVVGSVHVSGEPWQIVYDSARGEAFVTNGLGNLSVVNTSTDVVVSTVALADRPSIVGYDSGRGEILAANFGDGSGPANVTFLNDTSLAVVATVSVHGGPAEFAYDPAHGTIAVACVNSQLLPIINDTTDRVAATVPLASAPDAVAYAPSSGEMVVSDFAVNGSLALVNTTSHLVTGTASVLPGFNEVLYSDALAFDAARGELFSADWGNGSVSVINASSRALVAIVPIYGGGPRNGSSPWALAYDPAQGEVFVSSFYSDNVSVINDTTNTVVANVSLGLPSDGLAYDEANGKLYVAEYSVDGLAVVDAATNAVQGSIPVGSYPYAVAADPRAGEVFVTNLLSNNVTVINTTLGQPVASVPVGSEPMGVAVDPATGQVVVTNYLSNNVSVVNATTNALMGTVAVGANPLGVAFDPARGVAYVADSGDGELSILGTPGNSSHVVTFSETGLPAGTRWSVDLAGFTQGSNTTTLSFAEPTGTYPFSVGALPGFNATPSSGIVSVTGSDVTQSLEFTPVHHAPPPEMYPVSVTEVGLVSGTAWEATLGNLSVQTSTNAVNFSEPNGTFVLNVSEVAGYLATYPSQVGVAGAPVLVAVTFSRASYPVTFSEVGLPRGTSWSATATDGATGVATSESSTSTSLSMQLPDGRYLLAVTGPPGYAPRLSTTNLSVDGGSPGVVTVTFSALVPLTAGHSLPGWLATLAPAVLVGIFLAAAALWAVPRYRRRRWRKEAQGWLQRFREESETTLRPPQP